MTGVTLFALPKAFSGQFDRIQRNALRSWTTMSPRPEILLFGSDVGTKEAAAEIGGRHIESVMCNERGTPLLSDLFSRAEQAASGRILLYVNADILLPPDFSARLEEVAFRKFLVIGRRWDLQVDEPIDCHDGWWPGMIDRARRQGRLHEECGMDYFGYSRGLWGPIPPFAIGRTAWDNWLVYRARERGGAVVDATEVLPIIHQNHDYSHAVGGAFAVSEGPEAQENRRLHHENGPGQVYFGVGEATWRWRDSGLVRSMPPPEAPRTLEVRQVLNPRWWRFRVLARRILARARRAVFGRKGL